MSQSKRKQSNRRSTNKRPNSFERLGQKLKRASVFIFVLVATIWVGAWLWLSGTIHEAGHHLMAKGYEATKRAGFQVNNIHVEGQKHTDIYLLKTVLNTDKGDPILAVNLEYARQMVERINWVKKAHIERRLPGTLHIYIEERAPLALWQKGKKLQLIDSEGAVITNKGLAKFKDMLLVTGDDAAKHAPSFIATLKLTPEIFERADTAIRQGQRRWDIILKNGITIKLPEKDMEYAMNLLQKEQAHSRILEKDIKSIDLRTAGRLIVSTKSGKTKNYLPVSHRI